MTLPHRHVLRRALLLAAAVLAAGAFVHGPQAFGATFPDLYTVIVEPDEGRALNRQESEQLGMMQLLTRVTGRREAASAPELAHLVGNASDYVNTWGTLGGGRVIVGFNATAVGRELESANWPVWGAERPETLLWVAVDFGDGQRALMGETPATAEWTTELARFMLDLREDLDAVARERGLPITYPLLDLQDLSAISFAEVWGGFDGLVAAASERYGADAVLVGRIAVSELGPDVRWNLIEDGRARAVLGTDIRGGLDWLADQYAAEYSIAGGARSALLTVLDVSTFDDYARVMTHLESLSALQSVDVEGVDGSTLRVRIAARGDDSVVERLLTLGGVLAPAGASVIEPSADGLVFRVARAGGGGR